MLSLPTNMYFYFRTTIFVFRIQFLESKVFLAIEQDGLLILLDAILLTRCPIQTQNTIKKLYVWARVRTWLTLVAWQHPYTLIGFNQIRLQLTTSN